MPNGVTHSPTGDNDKQSKEMHHTRNLFPDNTQGQSGLLGINNTPPGTSDSPRPPNLLGPFKANTAGDGHYNVSTKPEYIYTIAKPQLPPFIRDQPEIWFCVVESEFENTGVHTDNAKYNAALKGLDKDTSLQITDLIHNPPTLDRYAKLKALVIERLSDSRHEKVNKLLHDLTLGEKKPSQLLREMKDLSKGSVADDILHSMWLSRLPLHIQPLLASSEEFGLNALAVVADRIIDVGTINNVMAVSQQHTPFHNNCAPASQITRLEQRMEEMAQTLTTCLQEITRIKTEHSTSKDHRSSSHPRSRSRTPERSGICFYHRRFGDAATECTIPCKYPNKSEN